MTTKLRLLAPLALVALVAGCQSGSSQGTTATSTPAASAAPSSASSSAPLAGGSETPQSGGGGASGEIAYVSGQLMQVQGDDMQTAVAWTDDTTITSEVAGTLADVVAGVCVSAVDASALPSDLSGTPDATATPEATGSGAATRVSITQPVDGECTAAGGFGGFGGGGTGDGTGGGTPGQMPSGMPSGMSTDMPGGMPTDLPSGQSFAMPSGGTGGGNGGFGLRSAGLVTAVDGTTITVQTTEQDGTTSTATITVDASTSYTTTVTADASALVVGQCVVARGDADSSGKVTATSLAVSAPTDGQCSSFGTGRGGNGLTRARTGGTGDGTGSGRSEPGASTQTSGGSNA